MTQAQYRVLVVEDEPSIRDILRTLLQTANYRVVEADTAARAEIEARSHKPDLLIVDLGLPDADGEVVIRNVRQWSPVPILVLSARTMEEQKIAALDAGADDYVTKPFSAPELLARARAALRRNARGAEQTEILKLGDLTIDLGQRLATTTHGPVHFTPMEFRVLQCLAREPGRIVTQNRLVAEVWGPDRESDTRSLRVVVKNIRQKIEPDPARPCYLVTEAGVGYRLVAPAR
ncbi:response regulator [Peristeroidobacter soli]|jgi:two-component system KDP operon response regulator KdpE|uniref:response regulator n=1 Tax=Peristeroidobacter soli TaxID=2497877 RepID=UPI00101D47CF|nr:response regulator [Peristeroidobacter soli]